MSDEVENFARAGASVSAARLRRWRRRQRQPAQLPRSSRRSPTNQRVVVGQPASFTVSASGTAPLSYQWQKGTTPITGATAASYTTPPTTLSDDGFDFPGRRFQLGGQRHQQRRDS